jgi:predicted lipid carrier protein YhbT
VALLLLRKLDCNTFVFSGGLGFRAVTEVMTRVKNAIWLNRNSERIPRSLSELCGDPA